MFYIAASHNDPISDSSLRRADVTFRLNASLPQRQHQETFRLHSHGRVCLGNEAPHVDFENVNILVRPPSTWRSKKVPPSAALLSLKSIYIQKERDRNTLVTKHLHRVTGAQGFCGSTAPPGGSSYVATVSWTSLRSQAGRPLICSSWNIQMHVAVLQWRRNTSAKENTSLSYQTHYHDKIIWKRVKNASEEHLNLQATSISKGWWGVREDLQWSQWRSKTPLASLRRWWQKVTF